MSSKKKRRALSPLENAVMEVIWTFQPVHAEDVRARLQDTHDLKVSTVRTLLRRLETKGYVHHEVEGRTYMYRATVGQSDVATSAVRTIVEKFCAGSIENLLVGLVDDNMISPDELQQLANQIAAAEEAQSKSAKKSRKGK